MALPVQPSDFNASQMPPQTCVKMVLTDPSSHPSMHMATSHSFTLGDHFEDNAQSFVNSPAFCSKTNDFLHTLPDVSVDEGATNLYGLLLKIVLSRKNIKGIQHEVLFLLTYGLMLSANNKKEKSMI